MAIANLIISGEDQPIPDLKADKPLRRKRETLLKRKPERRPWATEDGEPPRSVTVSKYLNQRGVLVLPSIAAHQNLQLPL